MSQLEILFKKQHPNYNESYFDECKKNVMSKIAKKRENFQSNNDWMTLDEINDYIEEVRIERKVKEFAGVK